MEKRKSINPEHPEQNFPSNRQIYPSKNAVNPIKMHNKAKKLKIIRHKPHHKHDLSKHLHKCFRREDKFLIILSNNYYKLKDIIILAEIKDQLAASFSPIECSACIFLFLQLCLGQLFILWPLCFNSNINI